MLNVTGLGYLFSTLSTVIEIVAEARITVVRTGPIAPGLEWSILGEDPWQQSRNYEM